MINGLPALAHLPKRHRYTVFYLQDSYFRDSLPAHHKVDRRDVGKVEFPSPAASADPTAAQDDILSATPCAVPGGLSNISV
jgi:hypothetical protein